MPFFEMLWLSFKWVLRKPVTSRYPFEPRRPLAGSRGQLVYTPKDCVYCTVCAKKCPAGALTVVRAEKKFGINRLRCISCGYCVELCPKNSLVLSTGHGSPAVTKEVEMQAAETKAEEKPGA